MTGVYKNIKVSGPRNQIFVNFETSSSVARKGFEASIHENSTWLYHNVLSKFNLLKIIFVLISFKGDSCQYWMDLESQRISSPYYPEDYFADGNSCEWLITAPEGHIIYLDFKYFNVSKNLNSKQKFSLRAMIFFLVFYYGPKLSWVSYFVWWSMWSN